MAIWIEEDAKVLVQGITGKQGMFHADKMVEYGTNIVGGCTPGKGGQTVDLQGNSYPVWNSMFEAIETTDADATVIYVPPPFAAEAIMEAGFCSKRRRHVNDCSIGISGLNGFKH